MTKDIIILILFLVWILRPLIRTKNSNKTKNTVERILGPDRSNFKQKNTALIIISTAILLALVIWLLPKFGINFIPYTIVIVILILILRLIFFNLPSSEYIFSAAFSLM